jgi:DNA polymerase III alpha subunit
LNDNKFPSYAVPSNETTESLLWKETYKGLRKKYHPITDDIKKRVEDELAVIKEMNFTEYFLIVWDIVREARQRGMLLIGRGSAANSIVAYCLGLTQVDPIELNLYFERFMNKARSSPPDVDIDFSWKERDEIIKYIFEEYGYEKVAMISTTVTFRARSAFREVAKTYGFTNEEISKFSKRIPWTSAANLPNLSKLFPESKKLSFNQEPWKSIVRFASRIAGFPRHLSIHPGGIVIAPNKITDYVALEYAKNKGLGLIVTQPDMYSIEDIGLIKIDILSQRSLGVLRDTMESIKN